MLLVKGMSFSVLDVEVKISGFSKACWRFVRVADERVEIGGLDFIDIAPIAGLQVNFASATRAPYRSGECQDRRGVARQPASGWVNGGRQQVCGSEDEDVAGGLLLPRRSAVRRDDAPATVIAVRTVTPSAQRA